MTVRKWAWLHKWNSIVCTAFMLLLCITGLPLIFHEEIDDALHDRVKATLPGQGAVRADPDSVVRNGLARFPSQAPHFLIWDRDDPNAMMISIGKTIDADSSKNRIVRMDANNAALLDAPDVTVRFTYIMLKLHTDMFAGLPGKLFLGVMDFCSAPRSSRASRSTRRRCVN